MNDSSHTKFTGLVVITFTKKEKKTSKKDN